MRFGSPPTAQYKSGLATCSRAGSATAERSARFLCELHPSGRNLDEAASGRRQGRVASARTYPRVGFSVTDMARPAANVVAFYNKRGTCEQWIKEEQGNDPMDAALVPLFRPHCFRLFGRNCIRQDIALSH
jgi:hypothetical protein